MRPRPFMWLECLNETVSTDFRKGIFSGGWVANIRLEHRYIYFADSAIVCRSKRVDSRKAFESARDIDDAPEYPIEWHCSLDSVRSIELHSLDRHAVEVPFTAMIGSVLEMNEVKATRRATSRQAALDWWAALAISSHPDNFSPRSTTGYGYSHDPRRWWQLSLILDDLTQLPIWQSYEGRDRQAKWQAAFQNAVERARSASAAPTAAPSTPAASPSGEDFDL